MSADLKTRKHPEPIRDEQDVLEQNASLLAENQRMKTELAALGEKATKLESSQADFERRVATETARIVSTLGINQGRLEAGQMAGVPAESAALAAHKQDLAWREKFRKH
jgi:hypothetical protein